MSKFASEAEPQVPDLVGIRPTNLTLPVLRDILGIYFAVAMSDEYQRRHLDEDSEMVFRNLGEQLRFSNGAEYRFGSRYTMHTKFWIWKENRDLFRFSLDPNMDREELDRYDIQSMVDTFDTRVALYLQEKGLAEPFNR